MKRAIFFICLLLSCQEGKVGLEKKDGIYFLTLEGTHYEMGYQHALYFKDGVSYIGKFIRRFVGDELFNFFRRSGFLNLLEENFPPELLEEVRGLVDGSNGELDYDVMVLASYGMYFVDNIMYNKEPPPMCSGFVAFGNATMGGLLINGRNMDWLSMDLFLLYPTIITYHPEGKHSFLSIGYPTMVGVISGMNDSGIAVSLLASPSSDCSWEGVDITLVLRVIMEEADSIEEAEDILKTSRVATGCNILLSSGFEKTGSVVERTATGYSIRRPENDILLVANHFLDETLASTQTGWEGYVEWSELRFNHLKRFLEENYGKLDVESAKSILGEFPVGNTYTVHSMVFIPEKLKVMVKMKGASDNYVEVILKK